MNESDLFSFGTLLRDFRLRKHLTQQQLAEAIGVHRHAIGRWEQGDVLPAQKAIILELAKHLHLDDQESRQLLEASLTALVPYWFVPYPRNQFFTGRDEIMEALHAQLGVGQAVALTQSSALHGLGGVGKTQIALEYAYQHALEYSAVFWIEAETEESIISSLLRIAETLQVPGHDDKDQQRVIAAVQRWLISHKQWLLIWDNVEDFALLDRFLPTTRSGAILLTTRRQALGTLTRGLELLPMEQEEGVLFLLRRAKVLFPEATSEQVRQFARQEPTQYAEAVELVIELGGLPLALDQAGAYLEETRCGLSAYLDLFRSEHAALLRRRGEGARDHPASVSTTFTLAITATAERHSAVWDLLSVCALLQPDAIPEEIFLQGSTYLGTPLEAVCRDKMEWDRVVGIACSYSLLSRQPGEQTLSLHRLVQAVLLETMTEKEQWHARVIAALDRVLPDVRSVNEYAAWKQCERLLTHALLCVQRTGATSKSLPLASLAHKTATYLVRRGRGYAEAKALFYQALSIREQILGPEHPEVATSLNHLAILLLYRGEFAEAELYFQRALRILEQTLGPEHPRVASSLNNLGILSLKRGKYVEAEQFYQRSLQICEQTLSPEHPTMAIPLVNLAEVYWAQGKYVEAEPLAQHALQIWEQALGSDHPQVAEQLQVLANILREQGEYAEAERLYQRSLQICEQTLSPEHPRVATLLNDLAECYRVQSRDAEAEMLFQRALQAWEQLVPEHPDMADLLNSLANLFRDRNMYPEAEQFYQRAISLQERLLDQHHPKRGQTLHDLALFRQRQGDLVEARALAEHALHIYSQALEEHHPKTVATRTLYTQLLQKQAVPQEKTAEELSEEKTSNPYQIEYQTNKMSPPLPEASASSSEEDSLREFLDACCELHSRAWCRSADLWQTYEQWAVEHQERFPLTRRAFAVHLKALGFRADHTHEARIWRGITVAKEER